jgi:hypothetical protein
MRAGPPTSSMLDLFSGVIPAGAAGVASAPRAPLESTGQL